MDYTPLRMGDTGPGVLEVQETLTAMGYAVGEADGLFHTSTLRSVIAFQSDHGLPVDGIVAVNTWLALRRQMDQIRKRKGVEGRPEEQEPQAVPMPPKEEEKRLPLIPPEMMEPDVPPVPMPEAPMPRQMEASSAPTADRESFSVTTVPLVAWDGEHPVWVPKTPEEIPVAAPIEAAVEPVGWTEVAVPAQTEAVSVSDPLPEVMGWKEIQA